MFSGKVSAGRAFLAVWVAGIFLISSPAAFAQTQTPDEACAADSLYLVSPDAISVEQHATGRPGLTISWQDLDTSAATCYTLTGTEAVAYQVSVEGGFGDTVDRRIAFIASRDGTVGQTADSALRLSWQTQGNASSGVLAGDINIANNGGLLRLDAVTGNWGQVNTGLPMTWFQTNITALAEGSGGFMVAAITSGSTLDTSPEGVWVYRTGVWSRIGQDTFADNTLFTQIAVSPNSNDIFALGTQRDGLYITTDGGDTFTSWTSELDPTVDPMPTNFFVGTLNWDSSRLWAFLPNFGLFLSNDGGNSFVRSEILVEENLDDPNSDLVAPTVINDIAIDPANADRVLLALNFNGVWETTDGGITWHDLYGDLNVPGVEDGEWVHSARSLAVDPGNSQTIVAGFVQEGLRRSTDGGLTWQMVGEAFQPSNLATLTNMYLRSDPGTPGLFYALEDDHSLLVSADSGATWSFAPSQPYVDRGRQLLVSRDGSGDLLMASYGGGIYEPGSPISLSDTYNTTTSGYLRDLDLGLDITLGTAGQVDAVVANETFNLICQTFQGWAVWRSPSHDRFNMTLLGIYDRVNPESCIVGYCGDQSYEIEPQCYISKRAACFNFDTPDTIRFFDDEVYNGFSYYYSVSTFDYGNTAGVSPQNNTNSMVFSPRFAEDDYSPFVGTGNISFIQINSDTADPVSGETIYVYPNPLRRDAGIPGSEGETVVFTNLPPESTVRVFTTAGDDVMDLGPELMQGGNIYWATANREGEPVAPGVYLYKVDSPAREAHWGKLVIIR